MGKIIFFKAHTQALDCRVCLEKLEDPRVLPCGHSFCGLNSSTNCIQKLDNPNGIKCPICRTSHTIQSADVPPNYALRQILDKAVYPPEPEQCPKHEQEIQLYCYTDKEKICINCLGESHLGHKVESVTVWRKKRLTAFWDVLNLQEMQERSRARKQFFKESADFLRQEYTRENIMSEKYGAIIERQDEITRNLNSNDFVYNDDMRQLDAFLDYIYHEETTHQQVDLEEFEKATRKIAKESEYL